MAEKSQELDNPQNWVGGLPVSLGILTVSDGKGSAMTGRSLLNSLDFAEPTETCGPPIGSRSTAERLAGLDTCCLQPNLTHRFGWKAKAAVAAGAVIPLGVAGFADSAAANDFWFESSLESDPFAGSGSDYGYSGDSLAEDGSVGGSDVPFSLEEYYGNIVTSDNFETGDYEVGQDRIDRGYVTVPDLPLGITPSSSREEFDELHGLDDIQGAPASNEGFAATPATPESYYDEIPAVANVKDGKASIFGTDADDVITIEETNYHRLVTISNESGSRQVIVPKDKDVGVKMFGFDGDDDLTGTESDDLIVGGSGFNKIRSLGGNDVVIGGEDNDYIDAGDGDDHVYALGGVNTVKARGGKDVIVGGDGTDYVNGGSGADTIFGLGGKNYLAGGSDSDRIIGGDKRDEIWGDKYPQGIFRNLFSAKPKWAVDKEDRGLDGADTIYALGGDDFIESGGRSGFFRNIDPGKPTKNAAGDNDIVYAGDGNDVVNAGHGNDWVDLGAGDDIGRGGEGRDVVWGRKGEDLLIGGNYFSRRNDNDVLVGGEGNDRLKGRGGNDLLIGGAGDDALKGGAGRNQLYGDYMTSTSEDGKLVFYKNPISGATTLVYEKETDQLYRLDDQGRVSGVRAGVPAEGKDVLVNGDANKDYRNGGVQDNGDVFPRNYAIPIKVAAFIAASHFIPALVPGLSSLSWKVNSDGRATANARQGL